MDEMTTSAITPMIAAAPMATQTQVHGKSVSDEEEEGGVSGGVGGEGADQATARMDDVSIVAAAPNTSAEASASPANC